MAVWLALAVLVAALVLAIAFAVLRGFQLYRDLKRLNRTFGPELDRINGVTLQIERHLGEAEGASRRLQSALGRLAVSRARLQIQAAAVSEARQQVRRVFWFVPGI